MSAVEIDDVEFALEMPDVATGGCSILMIGSTRSGKSTALKWIMDTYFKKHCGCLFSQSAKANAYKEMNYPLIVKSAAYVPALIHDMYLINKDTKNHYPFLIVIDDCPLIRADKELIKLSTIYRNSGLSSIVCCQNLTMLNPTCRSNINFILLFQLNNTEAIERTVKCFLRGYLGDMNMDKKIQWYRDITADHNFLFLDNLSGRIYRSKINISK